MKNLEDVKKCFSILEKNKLNSYKDPIERLEPADFSYFVEVLTKISPSDTTLVGKQSLHNTLRMLATKEGKEENKKALIKVIDTVMSTQSANAPYFLGRIFNELRYIQQIDAAFSLANMKYIIHQNFDKIMAQPRYAVEVTEACHSFTSYHLEDREFLSAYVPLVHQNPAHAKDIVVALSKAAESYGVYQCTTHEFLNRVSIEHLIKGVFNKPEHAKPMSLGLLRLLNIENNRKHNFYARYEMVWKLMLRDPQNADNIAMTAEKMKPFQNEFYIKFNQALDSNDVEFTDPLNLGYLKSMDGDAAHLVLGKIYFGLIKAAGAAEDLVEAEEHLRMVEVQSPFYNQAQGILFDILYHRVDMKIENPEIGSEEYEWRHELVQIQSYLDVNNYKNYKGAEGSNGSAQITAKPLLFAAKTISDPGYVVKIDAKRNTYVGMSIGIQTEPEADKASNSL